MPPAGSSASIYANWKKTIDSRINVVPIDYPGHGSKMNEPLLKDSNYLANKISKYISEYSDLPYIIFGHSLGGALIWKVLPNLYHCHVIDKLMFIVISGRPINKGMQHLQYHTPPSDEQILFHLKRYGNFPNEILYNSDALAFFLHIIRHDFEISNQLIKESIEKTNIPLAVFYGKHDPDIVDVDMMYEWEQYTEQWLGCTSFNGGHFYFINHEEREKLLKKLTFMVLNYKKINNLTNNIDNHYHL